jgi:hypothetical protein
MTLSIMTLWIMTLSITILSVIMLSVILLSVIHAECFKSAHHDKRHYAGCRLVECSYAGCRGTLYRGLIANIRVCWKLLRVLKRSSLSWYGFIYGRHMFYITLDLTTRWAEGGRQLGGLRAEGGRQLGGLRAEGGQHLGGLRVAES